MITLTGDDLFLPQLSHVINDAATLDYDLLGRDKKQPPWEGSRVPDSCRLQDGILVMLRALTSKHVDITKYLPYLAVYLFIVPLMESDGVGHISLDKWFPIVQHLHSRKNSGLNNPPVPGQPADCNMDRCCYKILPKQQLEKKLLACEKCLVCM